MTSSLRFLFTCSLLAAPLCACGDDKGSTDTETTQAATTDGTASTTDGTTTDGTTTDGTTTDTPTTDATTTAAPMTTTGPDTTTTTGPGTTSTTDGTTTDGTTGVGPALSWENDVYPVVVAGNCGCHGQGSGGLTMTNATDSYANLVGIDSSEAAGFKRVAAGDPANSYMLAKVKGVAGDGPFNGNPSQMPLGGPALPPDTIALLEDWILEGALP